MTVALSWVAGVTDVKHATVFDMISWIYIEVLCA